MSALAQQYGALNLAQGFPEYSSSPRLISLATQAMRIGHNQYAPMAGLPLLRERIATKISCLYGCTIDSEEEVHAAFTLEGLALRRHALCPV